MKRGTQLPIIDVNILLLLVQDDDIDILISIKISICRKESIDSSQAHIHFIDSTSNVIEFEYLALKVRNLVHSCFYQQAKCKDEQQNFKHSIFKYFIFMNAWQYNQLENNFSGMNATMQAPYQDQEPKQESSEEEEEESYQILTNEFQNVPIVHLVSEHQITQNQIINLMKSQSTENFHGSTYLTRAAYNGNRNFQQFYENIFYENITKVDQSGSLPIHYTLYNKNSIMFLYLFTKTYNETLILNAEGKSFFHSIIQNDDVYLFRFLSKFYPTNNLVDLIIENDSIECYKHYIRTHIKKYNFHLTRPLKEKIAKYNKQTSIQKMCSSLMDFHSTDAQAHLTVLFLIIFLIVLFMFSFSKVYRLDNILLYDFGLIMLTFYWLFCQIWFINQSYYVGAKKKQIDSYIPEDAKMLQIFKDYYDRDPLKGEVPIFNWYDEGKKILYLDGQDKEQIIQQWKRCEGLSKLLKGLQESGQIDILSLIVYLVENKEQEKIDQLDLDRWCPTCLLFKAQGTKHCSICNKCIKYQSHHSLFYNRCIDEGNQFFYLILMVSQWSLLFFYYARMVWFLIDITQSINIYRWILKIIELDTYGGFIYHILLFNIFFSNSMNLCTDLRAMSNCLTRNEFKNHKRYRYIDLTNRRPQGVVNNLINFFVNSVSNAKLM